MQVRRVVYPGAAGVLEGILCHGAGGRDQTVQPLCAAMLEVVVRSVLSEAVLNRLKSVVCSELNPETEKSLDF